MLNSNTVSEMMPIEIGPRTALVIQHGEDHHMLFLRVRAGHAKGGHVHQGHQSRDRDIALGHHGSLATSSIAAHQVLLSDAERGLAEKVLLMFVAVGVRPQDYVSSLVKYDHYIKTRDLRALVSILPVSRKISRMKLSFDSAEERDRAAAVVYSSPLLSLLVLKLATRQEPTSVYSMRINTNLLHEIEQLSSQEKVTTSQLLVEQLQHAIARAKTLVPNVKVDQEVQELLKAEECSNEGGHQLDTSASDPADDDQNRFMQASHEGGM